MFNVRKTPKNSRSVREYERTVTACIVTLYASMHHRRKIAFMYLFQPWQLLLVTLAGWINRQQQDVIDYIQEENRILKSKLKD